jgi:hypothetical protein
MQKSICKTIIGGLTALTVMAAAVVSSTQPASAFVLRGGGFHSGFGGFHPGFGGFHPGFAGFHPGFAGFRPGFRPGFVGFHPGFVGHRFFHPGFWRNGVWINGWWGPAVVTGVAIGAFASSCWSYTPAYDASGNFIGPVYVNLCQ